MYIYLLYNIYIYRARSGRNKVNSLATNDKVVCRRRLCLTTVGINHSAFGYTDIYFVSF